MKNAPKKPKKTLKSSCLQQPLPMAFKGPKLLNDSITFLLNLYHILDQDDKLTPCPPSIHVVHALSERKMVKDEALISDLWIRLAFLHSSFPFCGFLLVLVWDPGSRKSWSEEVGGSDAPDAKIERRPLMSATAGIARMTMVLGLLPLSGYPFSDFKEDRGVDRKLLASFASLDPLRFLSLQSLNPDDTGSPELLHHTNQEFSP